MPQKSSTSTTPLRRSTRLLDSNAAAAVKIQKPILSKAQVCTSPISSPSLETHLKSPVSQKPHQDFIKNSVKSVGRSSNPTKSNSGSTTRKINGSSRFPIVDNTPEIFDKKVSGSNESKRSTRKTDDGVDEFQGCRRSPRFSTMKSTAEAFKEKNCAKTSNGSKLSARRNIEGVQGCRRSTRLSGTENTPQVLDNKKCAKSSNGSKKSTRKMDEKTPKALRNKETGGNGDSGQLKCCDLIDSRNNKEVALEGIRTRKSVKRGRQFLEVKCTKEIGGQPEVGVMTPKERKEVKKKKLNVDCGTIKVWENIDTPECKKYGSIEELNKKSLTHFRTPLSSIENISPKITKLVSHEKSWKKFVESKRASDKSVKSICVSTKRTEKTTSRQCGVQGWTKDQELALHRAYFAAKPSPHFWKKISKLVPGKSAQDCFDKVQSDTITPPEPQPRQRSRADRTNSSPLGHFSLSGSKLLEPTKLNVKRSKGNKRSKYVAQKTARHLLQKQNLENEGHKSDLFSILEPTMSSLTQGVAEAKALSTPIRLLDKQEFLQNSLSTHKKSFSRFRDSSQTPLVSPPVLKPIKNMAFHEKYIDQLHCREAKRTAGMRRCVGAKEDRKEKVLKTDVIKAAKNALVCDARDMIKDFQHMQANALDSYEDFNEHDDDSNGGDDGEY